MKRTWTSLAMAHGALLLALALAVALELLPAHFAKTPGAQPAPTLEVRVSTNFSQTEGPNLKTYIKRAASGDGSAAQGVDAHAQAHCSREGVCTVTLRIMLPQADVMEQKSNIADTPSSLPSPKTDSQLKINQPNREDQSNSPQPNVKKDRIFPPRDQNHGDKKREGTATSESESPPPAPHGLPIPKPHLLHQQKTPFQHLHQRVQSQLPEYLSQLKSEPPVTPPQFFQSHSAPKPCFSRPESGCPFQSSFKVTNPMEAQPQPQKQTQKEARTQTEYNSSPSQEKYRPQQTMLNYTPSQQHSPSHTLFQVEEKQSHTQLHHQPPLQQHQSVSQKHARSEPHQQSSDISEKIQLQRNDQLYSKPDSQLQLDKPLQPGVTQPQVREIRKQRSPHFIYDNELPPDNLQGYTNKEVYFTSNLFEKNKEKTHQSQRESLEKKQPCWGNQPEAEGDASRSK